MHEPKRVTFVIASCLPAMAVTCGSALPQTPKAPPNPRSRYGPDSFVRKHRLIVNHSYDLPSPRNRASFHGRALGDWSVTGVTTVQSCHRLTPTFNNAFDVFGFTGDRPSVSGTCTTGQYVTSGSVSSKLSNYFNATCFAPPAVFSADDPVATGFGNASVGILTGSGQHNWDLAILKKIHVNWPREGANLEFRTEFFNAFNHPQFADPNANFTGTGAQAGTFGRITTTVVAPRVMQFALKFNFERSWWARNF